MYSDDVKLFSSISATVDSCRLQGDLDEVVRWCGIYGMCLKFSKCKKMTFFRSNALLTEYYIDNVKLEDVQLFNDLGVLFDRRLKFDYHVESGVSRAMSLRDGRRNLRSLPIETYLHFTCPSNPGICVCLLVSQLSMSC
ncbi:uncharacterized protein LOC142239856 [Haematobia irritans]|uniref:uncharacterized protein LOC142239856 n=1 Tax=Haematobia irritans TaxID=7368 RepID=UPI003F50C92B